MSWYGQRLVFSYVFFLFIYLFIYLFECFGNVAFRDNSLSRVMARGRAISVDLSLTVGLCVFMRIASI